jgi:hypothetical protein
MTGNDDPDRKRPEEPTSTRLGLSRATLGLIALAVALAFLVLVFLP